MGRKPAPKTPDRPSRTPAATALAIFSEALEAIHDEVLAIRSGKKKPKKFTAVETIAYLAKQASGFVAEQRKVDAASKKQLDQITPAMVLAWFRQVDVDQRQRVIREVLALDERRSGLA